MLSGFMALHLSLLAGISSHVLGNVARASQCFGLAFASFAGSWAVCSGAAPSQPPRLHHLRVLQPLCWACPTPAGWALHLAPRGPHYCGGGTLMMVRNCVVNLIQSSDFSVPQCVSKPLAKMRLYCKFHTNQRLVSSLLSVGACGQGEFLLYSSYDRVTVQLPTVCQSHWPS